MNMTPTGQLIVHRKISNLDGDLESFNYEWQGGSVTSLSGELIRRLNGGNRLKLGDSLRIGPFDLVCLAILDYEYSYTLVRTDNLYWRFIYFAYRLTPIIRLVYFRFIITLTVWNLAARKPFEQPSIQHVYAVKSFLDWFDHIKIKYRFSKNFKTLKEI